MTRTFVLLAIAISFILLSTFVKSASESQYREWECVPGAYWQKLKSYEILRAPDMDKLQQSVNERLRQGWRPMGDIAHLEGIYCQVMVQ